MGDNYSNYKLRTLYTATNDFDQTNLISQGGFWKLYKGVIRSGGCLFNNSEQQIIAVKRLNKDSDHLRPQLDREFDLLRGLRHPNVIRALGRCAWGSLFVYEHLENGCLRSFIYGMGGRPVMDWETRKKIIIGISKGLHYLHQQCCWPPIINCNITSSNIMLDADMNPRISYFGRAKCPNHPDLRDDYGVDPAETTASGYLPPEYSVDNKRRRSSTPAHDVYSFGVVILEMVTGNVMGVLEADPDESLIEFVWNRYSCGVAEAAIDAKLKLEREEEVEALRCLKVGLICLQEEGKRPSIEAVKLMLANVSRSGVPNPATPAVVLRQPPAAPVRRLPMTLPLAPEAPGTSKWWEDVD